MIISPNFSIEELLVTSHSELGTEVEQIPGRALVNLGRLAWGVLQPLREHFDRPILVTSGYRGAALNKEVGGGPGSRHVMGCAADFIIKDISPAEAWEEILGRNLSRSVDFDRICYYPGFSGGRFHVDIRETLRQRQLLFVNTDEGWQPA